MFRIQLLEVIEKNGGISLNRFVDETDMDRENIIGHHNDRPLRLPEEFVEFVQQLGFHSFKEQIVSPSLESIPVSADDNHITIGTFYGFGTGDYSISSLLKWLEDQLPKGYIPFAEGVSGDYFCLGVSDTNFGEVYYWHHESPRELDLYLVSLDLSSFTGNWKIDSSRSDTSGMASITGNLDKNSRFAKFLESTSDTGWKA